MNMKSKPALILAAAAMLCAISTAGSEHTAGYWNTIGTNLAELGQYGDAIKCYDKAIGIDPTFAWPWNNKGNAFYNLGEYNESIMAYDKSLEIDPQFAIAWYNKGKAFQALHRHTEATIAFAKAREFGHANKS
jgi:tetratricopeptide (TPR) repeat protein